MTQCVDSLGNPIRIGDVLHYATQLYGQDMLLGKVRDITVGKHTEMWANLIMESIVLKSQVWQPRAIIRGFYKMHPAGVRYHFPQAVAANLPIDFEAIRKRSSYV